MAGQAQMDISIWEKIGDSLNSFSEGLVNFLGRVFGSSNERAIRALGYVRPRHATEHTVIPGSLLDQVNSLEERMKQLSDAELKELTAKFRKRLEAGETLDDLLPEAFAACREAAFRTKNMRHFDVQILGGIVLHRGNIAEMVTGEGKTLVATLPAYLNALTGQGVHIVTVNDYLARRDAEWMSPIYSALGVTCGYIQSDQNEVDRRKAYDCDITYGTNSEFGFDYLRDNMKPARWGDDNYPPRAQQVQRALNYAIIDEVDNILIDEARTPLIISGPAFDDPSKYARANDIVLQLNELQKKDPGRYFEVKEKEHTVHLTDEGVRKAEELAGVESFYTAGNMEWPHLIDNALKAHHLYHKDKQYVVMRHPEPPHDMSVIIVDEFTGRLMVGRQWSDGLHQAVEAKHAREGVKIKEETQTLATITLQNFFKLYKKIAGMTGTAMTEANEFWKIYKLDVIAIPTNKPLIRADYPDVIYLTEKEKWNAVVAEIERMNKWDVVKLKDGTELIGTVTREGDKELDLILKDTKEKRTLTEEEIDEWEPRGRPILIGTTNVEKSEKLSGMLKRRGIKHELLNAKPEYAAREADIIAQAGRIGAVTISTNMAGRGTDIILGGNVEFLAWARLKDQYASRLDVPPDVWKKTVDEIEAKEKTKEEGRKVAEMGGLHVIGTERHEARRIDNQLRGRAGRQGDPGSSRFYLCLQDDLMRIFAGEWAGKLLATLGMEEGQAIESRMVSRRIEAAQKKVEEKNFDIRKNLLEYDEVMDHQRKTIYGYRQRILEGFNCKLLICEMLRQQIDNKVSDFLDEDYGAASFAEFVSKRLATEFHARDFYRMDFEQAERYAKDRADSAAKTQIHDILEENLNPDVEVEEWNWQAASHAIHTRWGIKLTEHQMKKIGRDNLAEYLIQEASKAIAEVDLSGGKKFLEPDWGLRSVCDWVRLKFQIQIEPAELKEKSVEQIQELVYERVKELYREKEIEFPVKLGMARFMAERAPGPLGGGQRYNREGLRQYVRERFPNADGKVSDEDFLALSRSKLNEKLLEISRSTFPQTADGKVIDQFALDERLESAFAGGDTLSDDAAQRFCEAVQKDLNLEIDPEELSELEWEAARHLVWNAYDAKYRPEMRRMERSLLLNHLDTSWKNHLYVMDHLRQGIGLRGYGQEDPKTVYKQEGMKEFDAMWKGIRDKVSETVFRMEQEEAFEESVWSISGYVHEEARFEFPEGSIQAQQQEAIANTKEAKKVEPIRNRGAKVGRNDPCPCGSGKKYKNCCMRKLVG